MKVVVIGGTGLIGAKVAAILRGQGHEVVAASPSTGVNALTGEGLPDATAAADVVVDLANSPSWEDRAVLAFSRGSRRASSGRWAIRARSSATPRPATSAVASGSTRSCRSARRASAASVWTNGSAAHRQKPDPASEVRPVCHERVPGNERKRRL
jgi:hypothetical protein